MTQPSLTSVASYTCGVNRDPVGGVYLGRDSRTTITRKPGCTGPGNRRNDPARTDATNPIVLEITDDDVARSVNRNSLRIVQLSSSGRTTITRKTLCTVPGHGVYRAGGGGRYHPSYPMVAVVGNVDVADRVNRDTDRGVHLGSGGRTTITRKAGTATDPSDRRDNPAQAHLANPTIGGVSDENVADSIDRNPNQVRELGRGSRTTITRKPQNTIPSDRRNNPARAYTTNPRVTGVSDEEVAGCVDCDVPRLVNLGGGSRTAIT